MLLISLSVLATSCATLPDIPFCVQETPIDAYCVKSVSNKKFHINEENKYPVKFKDGTTKELTYFEMKPMMIMLTPDGYSQYKKFFIKTCHKSKKCGNIGTWDRTIEELDSKLGDNLVP